MSGINTLSATAGCEQQNAVNEYFQSSASYWNDIYFDRRLWPTIYRDRQRLALRWIEELDLPHTAHILEIGCGAGFLSIALAQKGYSVNAMDSTTAMLELARQHASRSGVAKQIQFFLGDVQALSAASSSYDLVVALGVIPWLHSEQKAVGEMGRILKNGGHLLVTADNNARLNRLLDPVYCPLLKKLRPGAKWALGKVTRHGNNPPRFQAKRHYPIQMDQILEAGGLDKMKATTIGFGVLTFAGRQLIPNWIAVPIHRKLQRLADVNVFPFNKTGLHYMVLSRKETRT